MITRWWSPLQWYRRHRFWWERIPPALVMAGLFWSTTRSIGGLPSDWRDFLTGTLFLAGMIAPQLGQLIFVLVVGGVLYRISIYVAVLELAVLLPLWFFGSPLLFNRLIWALTSAWLVPYHLALSVPVLAALLWGGADGAWIGVVSALWLKVLANMNGLPADLLLLEGQHFSGVTIVARFQQANSLETLLWMLGPLASNAHVLLKHLLQILGWGLAALGVGWARELRLSRWGHLLLVLIGGTLGLWLGFWGIPWAVQLKPGWQPAGVWLWRTWLNILAAWSTFVVYQYLNGPDRSVTPLLVPFEDVGDNPPSSSSRSLQVKRLIRREPAETSEQDIIKLDLD